MRDFAVHLDPHMEPHLHFLLADRAGLLCGDLGVGSGRRGVNFDRLGCAAHISMISDSSVAVNSKVRMLRIIFLRLEPHHSTLDSG